MDRRAIYMTIAELYLLFTQRDLQGLVIFEEIREYAVNGGEMAQSMLSLAEKGILLAAEGGCYRLSEEAKAMLQVLEKAKCTFAVNGYLSSCPMQCFYFYDEMCLILQMDDFREGFIRLEMMAWEDAVKGFMDYEFMPEGLAGGDAKGKEELVEGDFKIYSLNADKEGMLADRSVRFIADRFPKGWDGADVRVVVVSTEEKKSGEERDYLVVSSEEKIYVEDYSAEVFLKTFSDTFLEGRESWS